MTQTTLPARVGRDLRPFFSRDPLSTLREEVDALFGRFAPAGSEGWFSATMSPSLDLSETNESLQAKIDLPGLKPEDIDIEVNHNMLRVTAERKEEKEEKGKSYHRVERRAGTFTRAVMLPCAVQEDKVQAEYHNGVLSILLPKAEEAKTRRIKIAAK